MKIRFKKSWMARHSFLSYLLEIVSVLPLFLLAWIARYRSKAIDIGIGPEPLINNVYHKKALLKQGYSVETFVSGTYFITDEFDLDISKKRCDVLPAAWRPLYLFIRTMFRYKVVFLYLNGGPLFSSNLLSALEPVLFKLAKVKIVVLPYGSDVQDMIFSNNLYFRHVISQDYPQQFLKFKQVRKNIHRWTQHADWIVSGVEWIDYMHHWNTLLLGHFSIDTHQWQPAEHPSLSTDKQGPLRIFHAPNHLAIKGTQHLVQAVDELKSQGLNIELVMLRGVPNHVIRETLTSVDLVADQFVVGWYAMFAIEAMALKKPVLCYLRQDLIELYTKSGLIERDEIPLINTGLLEIKETLCWAYEHRSELPSIGEKGRQYVMKHHSLKRIGQEFSALLKQIDVLPEQIKITEDISL